MPSIGWWRFAITLVARYAYDVLGRRIVRRVYAQARMLPRRRILG